MEEIAVKSRGWPQGPNRSIFVRYPILSTLVAKVPVVIVDRLKSIITGARYIAHPANMCCH